MRNEPGDAIKHYREHGYVVLANAIPKPLLKQLRAWADAPMQGSKDAAVITDEGELQAIYGVHLLNRSLLKLLHLPVVRDVLRPLIGDHFYLYQSQLHLKPRSSPPLDWHQDFRAYNHFDGLPSPDGVVVGTLIDTISTDMAPVQVIPGSHRHGLVPAELKAIVPRHGPSLQVPSNGKARKHRIRREILESTLAENGSVYLDGDAGTIFLCDPCIIHRSGVNPTKRRRAILYTNVFRSDVRPLKLSRPPTVVPYDYEEV